MAAFRWRLPSALSSGQIIVLSALFLAASANITFFLKVTQVYPWNTSNVFFVMSLGAALASVTVLATAGLSLIVPYRVVVSVLILLSAGVGYFSDRFGTIVDIEMIRNVLETNVWEALELLTPSLVLRVVLLGVLPVMLLWCLPVRRATWIKRCWSNLRLMGASSLVLLGCAFTHSAQYTSFVREHKTLRYYANPVSVLYAVGRYVVDLAPSTEPRNMEIVGADARVVAGHSGRELIVLVVGETARRDRFSLNGYTRETNRALSRERRVVSFTNIFACGTSTAVSVPCMFAEAGREKFDVRFDRKRENALDVLQRAGVDILWRDNNSGSKGVADRVRFEDFTDPTLNPVCDPECRDVGMLHGLQEYVDTQPGDVLIVLHQMGNHGPGYYKRYPTSFERFVPACHSDELASCSDSEISNAYDNAIAYTDYFLSRVVEFLKANTPAFETAMIYVSDHGESLGENGLYLHGLPYVLAPDEQIEVPLIVWVGETSDVDLAELMRNKERRSSHDALFHTLLSIFEIESDSIPDLAEPLFAAGSGRN